MNPIRKTSMIVLALAASLVAAALPARADAPDIESTVAVDGQAQPNTVFAATTARVLNFFRSTGTSKGDKLRVVWVAEDVGDVAPLNTQVAEDAMTAGEDDFHGEFSLTKPASGWAVGNYRVEIYLNDQLASTAKFTIANDAKK